MMASEIILKYGPFDLTNATVLITGGSSGIGQGLAQEFLKAGSTVIITGRSEPALKESQAKHPGLHFYVNDASKRKGPLVQEPEDWSIRQSEIAINIEAPVHLMQLLTPHFLKQKEAAFINITSGLAYIPCGFAPVYGGTKAFAHHFTMGSRFHYAKSNIRIVEIAPPAVKSNLGGSHDFGEECDVFCEHVFKRFAAGEAEIGFNMSEGARLASRQDNEKASKGMWDTTCKDMPVFRAQH
ncbi:hypothetical protein ABBQ38_006613 [Trebouxia sp. C0009 RCD-2024]